MDILHTLQAIVRDKDSTLDEKHVLLTLLYRDAKFARSPSEHVAFIKDTIRDLGALRSK